MDIVKPEPLLIGDRYMYTLNSYDPVSIEVTVDYVTDNTIAGARAGILSEFENVPEPLTDEWVAANIEGVNTVDEFDSTLRSEMEAMAASYAEQGKRTECANALAKRLCQQVPDSEVEFIRSSLRQQIEIDAQRAGLTLEQSIKRMGLTPDSLETMIDAQAAVAAQQSAALDALADERKLTVTDEEMCMLLHIPEEQREDFLAQVKASFQLSMAQHAAIREKAADALVAECSCTYHHQTLEEALAAEQEYLKFSQMMRERAAEPEGDDEPAAEPAADDADAKLD